MKLLAILSFIGAASAGLLQPVLLPKVNVAPTQVNIVRQPITITQPELVYRNVPVPVRAVAYTAPAIATPVLTTHSFAAPAIATHGIASPLIASHGISAPIW